jgi:NAD(P)-dependent dehydrogenase (short-subunit alcohol dehydrogenase family)
METFAGKLAVVTGGGSGMGRELVCQLATAGCSVATCDFYPESADETATTAQRAAPPGVRVTSHACDVSDEFQVLAFRGEVLDQHHTDHVELLFNNAGVGGGGSFVTDPRASWERTFGVDWWGVYYCSRAFLPLLVQSSEAVLVNTSSVNGFWAVVGADTAYSTAKFAVKGFSEALTLDLRAHAPHVRVAVVMPGHVGSGILNNSLRFHGRPRLDQANAAFRDRAPLDASGAAMIILDGLRAGKWRILVGEDAEQVDARVRADPDRAYDADFIDSLMADALPGLMANAPPPQS